VRQAIKICLDLGYSAPDIKAMINDNPKKLLGLN